PHPDAMDLYFQGRACWNKGMAPEHLSAARNWFARALSLDPHYAGAHLALGAVYMFTNRTTQGIRECERALALDRNLADAHGCIGMAKYFVGRAMETEGHVREALRLSPRDIFANRWL